MCFYPLGKGNINRMASSIENEQESPEERSEDDIFSILVATDIHLGYGEKDPIRC